MGPNAIYRISEKAITLAWKEKIDPEIHRQVMHIDSLIRTNPFIGWIENVPAYHTLTIFYDPLLIHRHTGSPESFPYVEQSIGTYLHHPYHFNQASSRQLRVPVCYDPVVGHDLADVSAILGMDIEQIIRLHTSHTYHVFMLGFLPGFPYMGILPEALAIPRKAVPALHVPAGTVAIAGQQTGIYPVDSPGGWYALGRTPVLLFREGRTYFEPGDTVEFYTISLDEYHQMNES